MFGSRVTAKDIQGHPPLPTSSSMTVHRLNDSESYVDTVSSGAGQVSENDLRIPCCLANDNWPIGKETSKKR